jgi:hypothetical protein
MPIQTESKAPLSDLLQYEIDRAYTRETVTLNSNAAVSYEVGTVLAVKDGKYAILAPAASDSANKAVAVLLEAVALPAGVDTKAAVLRRGAIIAPELLVWPASITDAQKTTALDQLDARGIAARPLV